MCSKSQIGAVIIDDSAQARKLLRLMLQDIDSTIEIVGEAENADDGLKLIQDLKPDVVFLDIEMPGKTGLQLAEELVQLKFSGNVVFTTAYDQYAIKAFRLSALDYLLKPIQEEELADVVQKISSDKTIIDQLTQLAALKENLQEGNNTLCVPVARGYEYIPLHSIICIEAEGSYVRIICKENRPRMVSKNLKYFENTLETIPKFKRTHRSYIVNLEEVVSFSKSEGGVLLLSDGSKIPVSRERRQSIERLLK